MNVCEYCKERYMCDRVLYDCPRDDKPDGTHDELTPHMKAEWEKLLHVTKS